MTTTCPNCNCGWDEVTDQQCERCDGSSEIEVDKDLFALAARYHDVLERVCFQAVEEYLELTEQHAHLNTIESVSDDYIIFEGEESACGRGCCGKNYYRISMPTPFLYDPGFRMELKQKIAQDKLDKQAEEHEKAQKAAAYKRQQDLARLAQLKEQYER